MNSGRRSSANGKVRGTSRNSKQSLFTSMLQCAYCGKNYIRGTIHPQY